MTTTDHYAAWVDPAELADCMGEYGGCDGPWCHKCGYRTDRSPLANGCGCAQPVVCSQSAVGRDPTSDWRAAMTADSELAAAMRAAARHNGTIAIGGERVPE